MDEVASRPEVADAINATIATLAVLTDSTPGQRLLVTSARSDDRDGMVARLLVHGLGERNGTVTFVDARTEAAVKEHLANAEDTDDTDDAAATVGRGDGTVVLHAPPVLAGADLTELTRRADGVLLVVHNGVTRNSDAGPANAGPANAGPANTGAVASNDPARPRRRRGMRAKRRS